MRTKSNAPGISIRSFERRNKMLALAAVCATVAPFYYTFLYRSAPLPWLIASIAVPVLIFLAHGMQALCSRMLGIRPVGGSSSYEDMVKRFQPTAASIPITVACCMALGAMWAIGKLMAWYASVTPGVLYDPKSLMPFLMALGIGGTMIFGIVLWFYPYNRILSMRTALPCCLMFVLNFLMNMVFGGVPSIFLALCLLIFAVIALLLMNQSYIIRAIDRSGTGHVTAGVLKYNTALVGVLVVIFLVIAAIMMTLLGGATALARMVLFAIRESVIASSGDDHRDWEEKNEDFMDTTFGDSDGGAFMIGQNGMAGLFMLFILLCIAVLAIVLLFRFMPRSMKAAVAWVKQIIGNLLHFLRTALDLWNGAVIDEEGEKIFNDYVDTTIQMEKSSYADSRPTVATRNYRAALAGMKTAAEKNRYCYQLLLTHFSRFFSLRTSDTPNEILDKVSARLESRSMPRITDVFVRFHYGGSANEPTSEEAAQTLDDMCKMLDAYERGHTE